MALTHRLRCKIETWGFLVALYLICTFKKRSLLEREKKKMFELQKSVLVFLKCFVNS